ncbi:Putative mycofactocin biosynthesis glycosyltransferase MftF [Defluviimonas aquaemixtae]|uniref:Mycofactocin biosynthesis glycosyltransferase MftF n=1 Tax=Albidovulum aquaemixtae TaxID=1542388 RepID=A0A2R8BKY9_9RHOB|nr:glycosyltransferase [Defluviimonas aquaemixtae]SPH24102.1 Putative mycofactocin biosynthesis glycosyltransferase MftF [Defluviimonas aquaemixtae]
MAADHVVIIPHYNDAARLRRCLTALSQSDRDGVEVVVVDNGSTETLNGLMADFPEVRFVHEEGRGAARARNRGVRESTAPSIFFLDADCVPAPDWLDAARRAAGTADIIGGAIDVFDETPPPRSGAEAFETVFAFNYRDYVERKGFSVTANLVTSRAVFEDVGPFIHGLSEDAEWCFRARDKGYRLALDEGMRVAHPTRSDWPALVGKWRRITREMYELDRQSHPGAGGRARWGIRAVAMAFSGLAHLPKLMFSPKLSGIGERLRGAGMLIRLRLLRAWWMLRQAFGGTA